MKTAMLFLLISPALAAQIVSYSPTAWFDHTGGVSVEAMGRGGASIAIADDAAGVWDNPAGIAAVRRPEAVLGLEGVRTRVNAREEAWSRSVPDGLSWSHYYTSGDRADGDLYSLGYAAGVKPFKLGERTFVLWAGYRPMLEFPDMKRTWTENFQSVDGSGQVMEEGAVRYRSSASFSGTPMDWGMALAGRLSGRLSAGIHLHYLQADVTEEWLATGQSPMGDERSADLRYQFAGLLWDAGLNYDAGAGLRFGAVYRRGTGSGFDYRIDQEFNGLPAGPIVEHAHLRTPDSWGLGAAWNALPVLRVALDYSRTDWSGARLDHFNSGVGTGDWTGAGFPTFYFGQKDTDAWRLGAEYRLPSDSGPDWTFRAGCFREEQNVLAPFVHLFVPAADQVVQKGMTLGATAAWSRVRIDAAYVHQSGKVDGHLTVDGDGHPEGGAFTVAQDRLLLSVTVAIGEYASRGEPGENPY